MKRLSSRLKITLSSWGTSLYCSILFLKHICLLRTLCIHEVAIYDSIVIHGNDALVYWNVRGCHKIKINGSTKIKGNIAGIRIVKFDLTDPLSITFYGIARRRTEQIHFHGSKLNLLSDFNTNSALPRHLIVSLNKLPLITDSISNLKNGLPLIQFEFPKIGFDNHPKSTYNQ